MHKLLVFTDIHITAPGETIIGLDPLTRFSRCLAHALAHHPDAARIVIAGDLTHTGAPAEYSRLHATLADCPIPVAMTLGNHDRRAAFRAAFGDVPVDPAGFVQSAHEAGNHRLILLDTADEEAEIVHSGRLCAARLDWLDDALDAAPDAPAVLFLHHPPIVTGFSGM
ncbi:MAG: metallophosphoesterase, partial [Roseovarius sp.]|nr:metallophosphoesterase [Roseovarius sp.]